MKREPGLLRRLLLCGHGELRENAIQVSVSRGGRLMHRFESS